MGINPNKKYEVVYPIVVNDKVQAVGTILDGSAILNSDSSCFKEYKEPETVESEPKSDNKKK